MTIEKVAGEGEKDFSTGLFEVDSDCLIGCCIPCIPYASIQTRYDNLVNGKPFSIFVHLAEINNRCLLIHFPVKFESKVERPRQQFMTTPHWFMAVYCVAVSNFWCK